MFKTKPALASILATVVFCILASPAAAAATEHPANNLTSAAVEVQTQGSDATNASVDDGEPSASPLPASGTADDGADLGATGDDGTPTDPESPVAEPADANPHDDREPVASAPDSNARGVAFPGTAAESAATNDEMSSTAAVAQTPGPATTGSTAAGGDATPAEQAGPPAPVAHVVYRAHVQREGWQAYVRDGAMAGTTGKSLRLEGISVYLADADGRRMAGGDGSIEYQAHVQNIGWQKVAAGGAMAGTSGRGLRLEGVRIMLTGDLSRFYDVVYRAHVQNIGWQGWVLNGAMAGTSGKGYRLEGVEVRLVGKPAGQAAGRDGIVNVRYRAHVQRVGWQPAVQNGSTAGTSGRSLRVEALGIGLDKGVRSGGIQYRSHVQRVGWQGWRSDGAMTGTSGRGLRMEALQIRLTGDIAEAYDVVYRAHVQNIGWQPWALNGSVAGTSGRGLRMEALQIKLVKKDSDQAISEGTYFLASAATLNLAIDVPRSSGKSGTQMQGTMTDYSNDQRFYIRNEASGTYSIQSVASGLFLAERNGRIVQVADSAAGANRWKSTWNGGFALTNAASGREIALASGKTTSGTKLVGATAAQKNTQRWTLASTVLIADGTYVITSAASKNVLDVNGANWNDGANVMIHASNGGGNQAFVLKGSSGNVYRITNAMTGKAIEVKGGSKTSGANVQQYTASGSKAQRWKTEIDRAGRISFVNQASGKALSASGTSSGANVCSKTNTGATLQKWKLTPSAYKPDTVLQRAASKANAYSSSTRYCITVDLANHRTVVFQGKKGSWQPIKSWVCSTGAPSSPTVLGNYTITGYRMYSFGHGYTCYYATQFWGDYLFHSVPYNEGTHTIQDGRLGYSVSLGCVRLAINNAKWIYDTIPAGTFVKTYY